jgi:D-inositol-3-phosphate glycosyltransferase
MSPAGPMNIAMVSEHANPLTPVGAVDAGGQNVHVAELARALAARGHRVRVYTRRDDPLSPERVPLAGGVEVVHVPAGPARPVPKDDLFALMGEFGGWLAREWAVDRPHLVHAHFWMSGLAALAAARPLGVPVVQTFHALGVVKRREQGGADTSPAERIRCEATIARTADLVLATSTDEVGELVDIGMRRRDAVVVPCGVDVEQFSPAGPVADRPTDRHLLIAVGRLVPRKGYDQVIRALPQIPSANLLIAGGPPAAQLDTDPEARRLRALAAASGVADRVRLLGQVGRAALPALLRSGDLMTCTPWYEPFGMTALEAMAVGLPVVASAVGGLTDTVQDGVTGRLVRSRDPALLARTVRQLLAAPDQLTGYRLSSVDRARSRYSWSRIAAETEAAYLRVPRRAPAEVAG